MNKCIKQREEEGGKTRKDEIKSYYKTIKEILENKTKKIGKENLKRVMRKSKEE